MNIFVLSNSKYECAKALCDQHVGKMLLETAQLLCSPFEPGTVPYKRTHYNHPCAKWVRETRTNWLWLLTYGVVLANEFKYRFEKEHKSGLVIYHLLEDPTIDYRTTNLELTPFAQAMPDKYKCDNAVIAYRDYYRAKMIEWTLREKPIIPKWTKRNPPDWLYESSQS